MAKKVLKKLKTSKKSLKRLFWKKGKAEVPILISIVTFGIALGGGLLVSMHDSTVTTTTSTAPPICCDSGNGDACHPLNDAQHPVLTYKNQQYGLLKSNIILREGGNHLKDSGQKFGTDPIIINTTDGYKRSDGKQECGSGVNDQLWNLPGQQPACVPVPNDEIVYVCRANCHPTSCSQLNGFNINNKTLFCYGDGTSKYDAYFRLSDIPNPGVPAPIKNCDIVSNAQLQPSPQQTITIGPYQKHESLQLHDFRLLIPTVDQNQQTFVSPYCKPAIYLYPQQQEQVSVRIAPKGNLKLTIPQYPSTGWDVTANPNGDITYQNSIYDYLFYEAGIPDSLIPQQNTGYVIAYTDLSSFFDSILPNLGLNTKEQQQFSEYWLKALPKNPYYRVSVVPEQTLNDISPLLISPKPDNVIRVTLYFQPLDKKVNIQAPILPSFSRGGFTVVEWGGLFKQDKNHPFTCLM